MQVQYAQLGDTQLAYVEQGIGTPVLFVHGAGGDWRTFDPLRDVVAQSYRYISLSRRYHYPNTWNDAGQKYTIDQHAQDLAGFIAALTLPPVHLVGGSYGGRVAAWFALRHPKLLRSLTISEPGLVDADTPEARTAVARWHVDGTAMIAALRTGDLNAATRRFFDGVLGFL